MRRTTALPLAIAAALTLGACGGSADGGASSTPAPSADVGEASAVTPLDDATIEAAKQEGEVLLYTNADNQLMAPVKKAFEAAYPEITLRSLALDDTQMFQRYETEVATDTPSADLVMSNDALGWLDFVDAGNVEAHEDPNAANLPDYATLGPGVYAISEDPVIALFNKAILPEDQQPTSMAELAAMAPDLDGKIATTDISMSVSYGATSAYLDAQGEEGWEALEAIGAHAEVEASNGPLATKMAQGQYAAGFFVGGAVRAFIVDDVAKVLNYRYFEDGTPLLPRGMAVTSEAPHPNAAKLFLNWMLSVEGQEAACAGGFTPYRDGVPCDFGLPQVVAAIGGEENLIIGTYDPSLADGQEEIETRWKEAFGR